MKLCMRNPDGQPGWQRPPRGKTVWVWLNDRKAQRVIAADDNAGKVWVAATDAAGNVRINPEDSTVELECLTGKVEIRILNS